MATINRTDRLFITILHGGNNLYTTEIRGLSTMNEIYREVKNQTKIETGIVTLHLRNSTQGWTQQHNIVLKGKNETSKNAATTQQERPYPSLFDSII